VDVFLAQDLLAQDFLAQDEAAEGGSLLVPLLMIVGLFAIFYFLLIRPQRKRREQQTQLQASLDVGDEVVTIGGLYGTVAELDERTVILETSEGVYARYARGAIAQKVSSSEEGEAESGISGADASDADASDTDAHAGSETVAEPRDSKD